MRCEECGRGPQDGVTLYRQNTKGEPGIWRCHDHNLAVVDREVEAVTRAIRKPRKR